MMSAYDSLTGSDVEIQQFKLFEKGIFQ